MTRLEALMRRMEEVALPYRRPFAEPLKEVNGIKIEPMALFKILDFGKVSQLLDDFTEKNDPKKTKEGTQQRISELMKKIKEDRLDDVDPHELLAVLFISSRDRWAKVDLRKEQKTIESVCEMLVGNSVNLRKGDGKTTVVIPVYSTMRALFHREESNSPQPALIVSTSDEVTLTDLQKEIRSFKDSFFKLTKEDRYSGKISEKLIDCQIPDSHQDSILSEKPTDFIKFASVNGIKILLLTHHQLIFETEKHKKQYGKFPPMIVDEVHLLGRSEYFRDLRVGKDLLKPTKVNAVEHYFGRLLVSYLEAEKNYLERFFTFNHGQPELTKEGVKFVFNLTNKFLTLIQGAPDLLKEVSEATGISTTEIINTSSEMWETIGKTTKMGGKRDFLANSLLSYITTFFGLEKGSRYFGIKNVRDRDRGIPLPSHEFNEEARFWLGVINKKILPLDDGMIYHYFHFSSWLKSVAEGRLVGVSGSLFEPTIKGGVRKSQLVETLENYTDGRVVNLSKKQPPLPIPFIQIADTDNDLLASVLNEGINTLKAEQPQPHFIICWNDEMANKLFTLFDRIGVSVTVIDKDSNRGVINNTLRDLSDGKIKIVITSGQGSFSQNIKDSFENYPNLKVTEINPETEYQVNQGFERKRAEKFTRDFNLFFEKNRFLILVSYLSESKQRRLLELLEKKEEIKKSFLTPALADFDSYALGVDEEIRDLTIDALVASQNSVDLGDKKVTSQDVLFMEHVEPMIREAKKKISQREVLKNSQIKLAIRSLIKESFSRVQEKFLDNLASGIQQNLSDYLSNIELSLYQEYLNDLNNSEFHHRGIVDEQRESYLKSLWTKKVKSKRRIWEENLKNRDYLDKNIRAYMQDVIVGLQAVMERIDQFFDSPEGKKFDREKLVYFQMGDLPFFPHDTDIKPKRAILFENWHSLLPFGQTMVVAPDLDNISAAIITDSITYVTLPEPLRESAEDQFFTVTDRSIKKYREMLQRLNPDSPFSFTAGQERPRKKGEKTAVLLPSSQADTKMVIIIVEN